MNQIHTVNFATFGDSDLRMVQNKDAYINNEVSFLQNYYHKENLLQIENSRIVTKAPYKVLCRYQPGTPAFDTWGDVYLNGEFERVSELEGFRTAAITEFMRQRKINSDQAAPRVNQIIGGDQPGFTPQIMMACGNARYQDQVGTNMVIDWKEFAQHNSYGHQTLRDYNQKFSRTKDGYLPNLQSSALANTLGVSVAIIAPVDDKANAPYETLVRMRGKNVAINAGTWQPALSFAAKIPGGDNYFDGTLKDFLSVDLNEEAMQETGLKPGEFTIKPLAICQDLGRGGKPELFLVAESAVSLFELNKRLQTEEMKMQKREAIGDFLIQENADSLAAPISPQSIALSILVQQQYNMKKPS